MDTDTRMSRWLVIGMFAWLALVVPARAWAHAGHTHTIMGTVVSRDAKALEVKTPSGEVLSMALAPDLAVVRGKQKAVIADVVKGIRVVVDIGDGEDPLVAHEIRLGVVPTKAR
jgi:hypothetical protein